MALPLSGPVVNAPCGAVEGSWAGALNVFKGIAYATAERWRPPVAMARWSDVRQARDFGPACSQPPSRPGSIYEISADHPQPMSEDCLTLNIWAPVEAHGAPVLVWIHGGSLVIGASREPFYDGARLAAQGVVVVTINYRLGVFGYFAHPELSVSGNYGLRDQIAALNWVARNIAAFGGDPANVTIAGESAGALSILYLMAAPPARGLFAKAILQSAYMISTPGLKQSVHGHNPAEEDGATLADRLGAPDLAAMQAMEARPLAVAAAAAGFAPFGAIDGDLLPRQLVDVFDCGEQAPVPVLAGFNSGEIRTLTFIAPPLPASSAEYEAAIRARYGDLAETFLGFYPGSDLQESIYAATRDAIYGWTAERIVRRQTALGQPAFLYFWDHGYATADTSGRHAFHGSEIPYVFGTFDRTTSRWPKVHETPQQRRLSEAMIGYWTSFARSGKPEAADAPAWPAYGSAAAYMAFEDVPQPAERLLPGRFELHEEVVRRRQAKGDVAWNWNVGLSAPLPK